MSKRIKHLISPVGGFEHSFCGMAFDAFASDDLETDDAFIDAPTKETINCPDCIEAVAAIRLAIKGVKFKP